MITGNIDVVKSGTAGLTLNAPSNNTYTGTTYVNGGSLILNTGYVAIPGALVINNGGSVLFKVAGQIASNSAITINEGGFFNVNNAQVLTTSGLITINNGQLYESNGNGVNANGGLAFNGGFVTTSAGNAGTITLGGNVSYASSSTTAAVFQQVGGTYGGSAINTTLSLGNATRTFNIADSSTLAATTPEMTVGFNITSTGSSGQLVKTGDGVLRLTGGPGYNISNSTSTGQNSYSGGTVINAGTLNVGYASNVGVTANGTAAGAPNNTALVFFAAPVNLILGQKLNGSDSFVASILSPTEVLMSYNGGATMTNALTGNLTSFTFDATVAQSGRLLGTGTVTINGGASGDTPALLADSGVTTANAITVGTTGTSRTIGSSSTSGTATYTGNITLNGGVTLSAAAGGTVAFNTGTISGAGNVTKSGAGTVTLSGTNTYTGATTVSGGTLQASAANALGSTSGIMINTGGTLLVSANASIGPTTTITMNSTATGNGTAAALKFSSSYNGTVGTLTLDANSIFDLGTDPAGVRVHFSSISGLGTYTLAIYNWTGTTLWEGGTGNNLDQIYAGGTPLTSSELQHISFYSGLDASSFRGTGYQIMSGSFINELGPVPEPGTWVAMLALIITGGIMGLRRRRQR